MVSAARGTRCTWYTHKPRRVFLFEDPRSVFTWLVPLLTAVSLWLLSKIRNVCGTLWWICRPLLVALLFLAPCYGKGKNSKERIVNVRQVIICCAVLDKVKTLQDLQYHGMHILELRIKNLLSAVENIAYLNVGPPISPMMGSAIHRVIYHDFYFPGTAVPGTAVQVPLSRYRCPGTAVQVPLFHVPQFMCVRQMKNVRSSIS